MAKLPEGVYVRGKKLWIRFTPIQGGRQIRMPTGLRVDLPGAAGQAKALRAKLIVEAFEGRWFPEKRGDCHLVDAVNEYLDTIEKKRDFKAIKKRLEHALEFFGRGTPVSTITHKQIRGWQREVETEKIRGGKTRAPMTVVHFLVALRCTFKLAVESKLTNTDPMEGYKLPEVDNARTRTATEEELSRLVAGALDQDDRDLADAILLANELGLRQEKIIGMHWENIDGAMYLVPPTPGGKPVPKKVPLSKLATQVLRSRSPQAEGPIFPGITANQISMRFGRLTRKLKIKNLRFHDLRHTIFTELERAGVGLRTIKEISGHKTVENLFRYQNPDDADLHRAMEKRVEGRRTEIQSEGE